MIRQMTTHRLVRRIPTLLLAILLSAILWAAATELVLVAVRLS